MSYIELQANSTATIANGASLSGAVDLGPQGLRICAIQMPASWTAANLTFQGSFDGTTYANIYDDSGNEYTVTAAASEYLVLTPQDFATVRYIKVRSGTSGSAVNQGASRDLTLIARPL